MKNKVKSVKGIKAWIYPEDLEEGHGLFYRYPHNNGISGRVLVKITPVPIRRKK